MIYRAVVALCKGSLALGAFIALVAITIGPQISRMPESVLSSQWAGAAFQTGVGAVKDVSSDTASPLRGGLGELTQQLGGLLGPLGMEEGLTPNGQQQGLPAGLEQVPEGLPEELIERLIALQKEQAALNAQTGLQNPE